MNQKLILTLFFGIFLVFTAQAYETQAKAVAVYHPQTERFVLEHNANTQIAPASLVKLMTVYLLFDAINNGTITLETEMPISKKAWRKGGSKMFVEVGKKVKVKDLLRGIIISSGNDAAIVAAEYLAGTEEAFTNMMNSKAAELNLHNTVFKTATGWPHPEQLTTAHDMALLAAAIIKKFPQYYNIFSEKEFTYSKIRQNNRNRLLLRNVGVDGLKTGHTEESGFHLVASGAQNNDRLISVVLGTTSFSHRENETLTALRHVFNRYQTESLLNKYQELTTAPVWMGEKRTLPLVAAKAFSLYIAKDSKKNLTTKVIYNSPLKAPIVMGDVVGHILITEPTGQQYKVDLLAGEGTPKLPFIARIGRMIQYNLGWN